MVEGRRGGGRVGRYCNYLSTTAGCSRGILLVVVIVHLSIAVDASQTQQQYQRKKESYIANVSTVVKTTGGLVMGYIDNDCLVWSGIPYAASTASQNRFKPPQPVTPWSGIKECFTGGPVCPQKDLEGISFYGDEDCLNLDVYAPINRNTSELLPVMVWFYGGGFFFGDKYEFGLYDATNSVNNRLHIHVAPNYRLNSLGFLALPMLLAENMNKSTGNYGMQDQVAALHWVRRNIINFGGDPNQVTIFGESAGAFSVCWHLVNPTSANLFHAAILESGTCDSPNFFIPLEKAYAWSYDFAANQGCTNTSTILQCLRALPFNQLLNLNFPTPPASAPKLYPIMPWGPVIDGSPIGLRDLPLNLLKAGKFNKVPTILGTNENEGTIFLIILAPVVPNISFPLTEIATHQILAHFFNTSTSQKIIELYDTLPTWETFVSTVLRDYFFICSARRAARALAQFPSDSPPYLYHFTFDPNWPDVEILGMYHSVEIEFVFENAWPPFVHEFDELGRDMADAMSTYWDNHARYLTPNGKGGGELPYWPQFNEKDQVILRLDVPPIEEYDLMGAVCSFWDGVHEI